MPGQPDTFVPDTIEPLLIIFRKPDRHKSLPVTMRPTSSFLTRHRLLVSSLSSLDTPVTEPEESGRHGGLPLPVADCILNTADFLSGHFFSRHSLSFPCLTRESILILMLLMDAGSPREIDVWISQGGMTTRLASLLLSQLLHPSLVTGPKALTSPARLQQISLCRKSADHRSFLQHLYISRAVPFPLKSTEPFPLLRCHRVW